jgi:hypothetical protein
MEQLSAFSTQHLAHFNFVPALADGNFGEWASLDYNVANWWVVQREIDEHLKRERGGR